MGIALFMQATPTYQIPRCIPRTVNFRATRRFWLQWLTWSVILRQSNCSQQRPLTESLGYSTQESRRILLPWNWVNTKKNTDVNIQRLILLSHHRAVYGTFWSFCSKLTPHYLFSRNCNGLKSSKTGAAHLLAQVQSDGQFKPIYQCKLISEEHPQSSQQGSAPQMEVFAQWLSPCEGMSPWSRSKQTGHLAQLQGTKMISNKKSTTWLKN